MPIVLGLFVAVLAVVFVVTGDSRPESASPVADANSEAPAIPPQVVSPAKRSAPVAETPAPLVEPKPDKPTRPAKPASGPVTLQSSDHETLVLNNSKQVIVEGAVVKASLGSYNKKGRQVRLSLAGKTTNDPNMPFVIIVVKGTELMNTTAEKFKSYVGKNVRVSCNVRVVNTGLHQDVELWIKDLSAVEIVE